MDSEGGVVFRLHLCIASTREGLGDPVSDQNEFHTFCLSVKVALDLLCGAAVSSERPASAPPRDKLPVFRLMGKHNEWIYVAEEG